MRAKWMRLPRSAWRCYLGGVPLLRHVCAHDFRAQEFEVLQAALGDAVLAPPADRRRLDVEDRSDGDGSAERINQGGRLMQAVVHGPIIGPPKLLSIGLPIGENIRLADMEPWAKRVRELLDEGRPLGLNDAGLAKACKAKQPSIWQWFKAPKGRQTTKNLTAINAVRAARYLGTTAEYIVTGQGSRRQSQNTELDLSMLQSAIVSVKKHLRARGLELDVFVAAPMIAYAYRERMKLPRELSQAEYAEFDSAIADRLRGELGHGTDERPAAASSAGGDEEIAATTEEAGRSARRRTG
jgi:hypothetical protein